MRHLHLLVAALILIAALGVAGAGADDQSEFSLTPGPIGIMPGKQDVYISILSVPIDPEVTITFDGGPGINFLTALEATMYTSDGRIIREYFETPIRVRSSVVLTGTRYADRIKVTAYYVSGEEVVISDAIYGRGTAPDRVSETPVPVTPAPVQITHTPAATPIAPLPTSILPERTPDIPVPRTQTIIPAVPPPPPATGYLITVSPAYATAYPGTDLEYSLTVTAAPDFQQPVYLVLHIDAVVTSLEYDLGRVDPPYPKTVLATVPIPSYLPGGIDVSGRVVGTGGGITRETSVELGLIGSGATIQETVVFSGAAAGILIAGGMLGLSAAGVSSALASLQSSVQQVSPTSRPQWYAGQTTGIAWRRERGYTWSGIPGADGAGDPDLPDTDPPDGQAEGER